MALKKSVILAAGRGVRMGAATLEIPKPMLPVRGRPLLEHILDRLEKAGLQEFCIVVGYRGDVIERHFRTASRRIQFLQQDPVDGTGSAAFLTRDFVGNSPFLLTFGDILCEPEDYVACGAVLDEFPDVDAVLGVTWVDDPWQGAAVYEHQGQVSRIIEKPPRGSSTTHWNSAGIYTFRPILFDYLRELRPSPRNEYELTSAIDAMLRAGCKIRISPMKGSWRDVGRPEDLAAENEINSPPTPLKK